MTEELHAWLPFTFPSRTVPLCEGSRYLDVRLAPTGEAPTCTVCIQILKAMQRDGRLYTGEFETLFALVNLEHEL